MERLTRKTWVGDYASANDKIMFEHQEEYNKLGKYEDTNLTPEEVKELAEAKAEGQLPVLPCRVGDTVWAIRNYRNTPVPQKGVVSDMVFDKHMKIIIIVKYVARGTWGEKIFATREEAEAALQENISSR